MLLFFDSADDYTRGYMNSRAMLEPSGNVFWPPPTKFRSTCPVDVTYFPFDDQTCIMKMGSWIYDGLQVDVMNRCWWIQIQYVVADQCFLDCPIKICTNVDVQIVAMNKTYKRGRFPLILKSRKKTMNLRIKLLICRVVK